MVVRQDLESGTALLVLAWVSLLAGLGSGMTHLGQPLKAWRAFLGLRTSWFSREVVVFGLYAAAVTLAAAMALLGASIDLLRAGCAVATLLGLLAVFCSAMIYKATRREFWAGARTLPRFFGTVGILGASTALAVVLVAGPDGRQAAGGFALVAGLFSTIKLGVEVRASRLPSDTLPDQPTPIARTALLLRGELGLEWRLRWLCGITGGVALPFMILLLLPSADLHLPGTLAALALALSGAGEWIERRLFFTAVSPDRMPGGVVA
jgi:DMSO reductase anchor subunit